MLRKQAEVIGAGRAGPQAHGRSALKTADFCTVDQIIRAKTVERARACPVSARSPIARRIPAYRQYDIEVKT